MPVLLVSPPGLLEPVHCLSYLVVEIEVKRANISFRFHSRDRVAIYAPVIVLRQSFCLGLSLVASLLSVEAPALFPGWCHAKAP